MMRFGKCLLIGALASAVSTWAVRAAPFLINSTQPDGSVVQIRNVGNEHFNYTITGEDSVLVVRDSAGYWNYADEQGRESGMRVHAKSKRGKKELDFLKKRNSHDILKKFREKRLEKLKKDRELRDSTSVMKLQSSGPKMASNYGGWGGWGGWTWTDPYETEITHTGAPTRPLASAVQKTGEVRGIVILVQFSDVKFNRNDPKAEYEDYLNKEGYSDYYMSGSVRDFFIHNSSGKYKPTFDVYGPITLTGTRDSYGAKAYANNMAAGAAYAVSEAMDQLVAQGVDFSPYDSDGDKTIDFVYMIYAGVGSADSDVSTAIWPHSYSVRKRLSKNLYMERYACSPEIDGRAYSNNKRTDALNGIGTFCHEFSHVLGLEDHYDVNVNETGRMVRFTPNAWDLMDQGSYNCPTNSARTTSCSPANLSAFERFSLGWLEPRYLEVSDTTITLKSINENDGLVLVSKNDNEYYFVDFRLKNGFDAGLPNKGMLIWHVYYETRAWAYNEVNASDPMHVDLIEADGRADSYSLTNDAFPTGRVNSYNGFVTWAGDSLGLEIYNIKLVDDYVTFNTRGSRDASETPKVSSSSVASSSSEQESSSSTSSVSSSSVESSSSEAESSSAELSSSSEAENSSSSVESTVTPGMTILSSSSGASEGTLTYEKTMAKSNVSFSVKNGVFAVLTDIEGLKTVRLFDMNGALLVSESFTGSLCKIQMNSLPKKSFVVGSLDVGGRLVKTIRVQVR